MLDETEEEGYQLQRYARPPGYCAQTLLHFGELAVVSILDYGAAGMPDEVIVRARRGSEL